jgi:hypothetical protein
MFVRKRASGNQLIEAYRDENGNPRQRVVCNLGEHETPEEALEAAKVELDELLAKPRKLEAHAARYEERMKEEFEYPLQKWHGGEIPPLAEVLERAAGLVELARSGYPSDPNLEDSEYAADFVDTWGWDVSDFVLDVRELEELREEAREAREAVEPEERSLRERIATLEGVVSE